MTTLDTLMRLGESAERTAQKRREHPIYWRVVAIGIIVIIPRLLGMTIGAMWRVALLMVAAVEDGFRQTATARPVTQQSEHTRPAAAVATRE